MKKLFCGILHILVVIPFLTACNQGQKQEQQSKSPEKEVTSKLSNPADSLGAIEYNSEACDNVGFYSKAKYTPEQIQNTYNLMMFEFLLFETDAILQNPEDLTIEKVGKTIQKLDEEYSSLKVKFRDGKIVETPFWLNIKMLRLLELQELYKLKRLTLEAHLTPEVLAKSVYAKECADLIKTIAATDTAILFQGCREFLKKQQGKNGYPENLTQRYREEYDSPHRIFFAKRELLQYGWWNCANNQRKYIDTDNQFPLLQEFEKLFVRIKADCADLN